MPSGSRADWDIPEMPYGAWRGWLAKWSTSRRGALLGGILAAAWSMAWFVPVWIGQRNQPPSWTLGELDTTAIHQGILAAPRFADTLRWWTGPWVWGIPFYRPLTSLLFWTEYQLLGEREWLFAVPTAAVFMLSCALFALVTHRLAQEAGLRWPALAAALAAAGFAGLFAGYRASITALIYQFWKNQPDSMAAVCLFASLLMYLRSKDRSKAPVGATLWYLAACGFKEMAVPLPLLAVFLEPGLLRTDRRAAAMRRLAWLFAAAAMFLVVRHAAIGGIGYTYGRNQMWLFRTFQELVGPFLHTLTGNWEYNAVGLVAFLWLLVYRATRNGGGRLASRLAAAGTAIAVVAIAIAVRPARSTRHDGAFGSHSPCRRASAPGAPRGVSGERLHAALSGGLVAVVANLPLWLLVLRRLGNRLPAATGVFAGCHPPLLHFASRILAGLCPCRGLGLVRRRGKRGS